MYKDSRLRELASPESYCTVDVNIGDLLMATLSSNYSFG